MRQRLRRTSPAGSRPAGPGPRSPAAWRVRLRMLSWSWAQRSTRSGSLTPMRAFRSTSVIAARRRSRSCASAPSSGGRTGGVARADARWRSDHTNASSASPLCNDRARPRSTTAATCKAMCARNSVPPSADVSAVNSSTVAAQMASASSRRPALAASCAATRSRRQRAARPKSCPGAARWRSAVCTSPRAAANSAATTRASAEAAASPAASVSAMTVSMRAASD